MKYIIYLVLILVVPFFSYSQTNINLIYRDADTQQELDGVEMYFLNKKNKRINIPRTDVFGFTNFETSDFGPGDIIQLHHRKDPDYYENLKPYDLRISSDPRANNFKIFLRKNVLFIILQVQDELSQESITGVQATYYKKDNQAGEVFESDEHGLVVMEIHTYKPGDELKILLTPPAGSSYRSLETTQYIKSNLLDNRFQIKLSTSGEGRLNKKVQSQMNFKSAQSILDKAKKGRDGSQQGQNEALAYLIKFGYAFNGVDFSGISFEGASLNKGIFDEGKLHGVNFAGIEAKNASFRESGLRFAQLQEANMEGANLRGSYCPFIWGEKASFEGADLSGASFFCADLREANFKGANLSGTAFAFADLRGANFEGANLSGAYFNGAILDDAIFTDAVFSETDMLGAVADNFQLSEAQKEKTCRHVYVNNSLKKKKNTRQSSTWAVQWYFQFWESWPSPSAHSGTGMDKIVESQSMFVNFDTELLPACTTPAEGPPAHDAIFVGTHGLTVDRSFASKNKRKAIYKKRVEDHIKLLEENMQPFKSFRGPAAIQKEISLHMNKKLQEPTTLEEPYFNSDLFAVLLSKANISDNINWEYLAFLRWHYEYQFVNDDDIKSHSYWGNFYPRNASWVDLPNEKFELYKKWVKARAKTQINNIVIKHPLKTLRGSQNRGKPLMERMLLNNAYEERFHQNYRSSVRSNTAVFLSEKGISADRIYVPPVAYLPRIAYVFPRAINSFEVTEQPPTDDTMYYELDLALQEVETTKDDHNQPIILLHVNPQKIGGYSDKVELWSQKIK